ncbi:MAG: mechanosensitive ion channel family protein [Helicobacteraceae bacterium]|jgi:small-conductance mechanosensitive channel|nr:mechanosensitive ion channel family protein [Helicobacteraceae bacterium]
MIRAFIFFAFLALSSFGALKDDYLNDRNIWIATYKNHIEYESLRTRIDDLNKKIARASLKGARELNDELALLEAQLISYESLPKNFPDLLNFPMPQVEKIRLNLISYIAQTYQRELERSNAHFKSLEKEYILAIAYLDEYESQAEKENDSSFLERIQSDKRYFEMARALIEQKKRALETIGGFIESSAQNYKEQDLTRILATIVIALIIILALWFAPRAIRRYGSDAESAAFWIRALNLAAAVIAALFLIFNYIDNLLYALTFVGFVAAGLTIVLKEAVLNFVAWIRLVFGGAIAVGDRILIYDSQPVIGDVIGISPMSLTLYENITHNNAAEIKRAGRVVFIPNNFLFTKAVYNYTHDTMKTLYDLIEIPFEIKSDFEKIRAITEESVLALTGRYIEMARLQYDRLRNRYTMRGKKMRPKIQFMLQEDGRAIRMYLWYIAPYRDILNIRSAITLELLRRFKDEPNISLIGEEK